jgi:EAL domain-containing protein (putative c-di-GMP-specific phosphodiesterase class I)
MRWKKGDKIVNPDYFIDFLEESSLILEVGEMLLDSVCKYLSNVTRCENMPEHFKIAVNISNKQIVSSQFIQTVSNVLTKHRISGNRLEFEITESVALYDIDETIKKIETLKKMGITFALDDFGTGYSSLSYLSKLPVDKLKIDRSFVHQ